MRYRRLNPNGDMTFGHQQADFLRESPDTVAQAILTRLKLWLGEWFVDQTEGTPYQQAVLGKRTRASMEPAMRSRILDTPGVTEIVNFDLSINPDTRIATFHATVNTLYGPTPLTGVL